MLKVHLLMWNDKSVDGIFTIFTFKIFLRSVHLYWYKKIFQFENCETMIIFEYDSLSSTFQWFHKSSIIMVWMPVRVISLFISFTK